MNSLREYMKELGKGMDAQLKKTITLVAKGLGVVAFVTTAYLTININIHRQRLKDIQPVAKSFKACNDRVQQTTQSYLSTKLAHVSMTAGFVRGSSDCLKESGEDLSKVGGLSASLMNKVVAYSKNVSDLHKLVLRPKNKDTYKVLKEKASQLEASYSEASREFQKIQKDFSNKSSFINNNFYLLSIGTLLMSLIINLLSWRSKKSNLIAEVEREASELSLSGKFDNGQEVEAFVSRSLTAVGLHNVENLLSNYLKYRLKKHAMEMKFDKIDELTAIPRHDFGENEDLDKISEVVHSVSSRLDLLDSISDDIKEIQSKGEGQSGLDNILKVVNAAKSESKKSKKDLSENLIFILNKINELEEENVHLKKQTSKKISKLENEYGLLKESTTREVKRPVEVKKTPVAKVVETPVKREETPVELSQEVSNENFDLETCVLNCVNEVSASNSSRDVRFDVNIDSGITLGKSREGVVKIMRELVKQSIENNRDITEEKILTIKSKSISSGVLLNCTMKQVDSIEDIGSMKLSSQNFHIFDPIEDTNTEMISSHFTRLTDINGEVIGTRYNFCLELDTIESKELPQAPSLFNN